MPIRTIFKIALVLIAALVVAGIAVLRSMDFNQYRALIAEQARETERGGKGGQEILPGR